MCYSLLAICLSQRWVGQNRSPTSNSCLLLVSVQTLFFHLLSFPLIFLGFPAQMLTWLFLLPMTSLTTEQPFLPKTWYGRNSHDLSLACKTLKSFSTRPGHLAPSLISGFCSEPALAHKVPVRSSEPKGTVSSLRRSILIVDALRNVNPYYSKHCQSPLLWTLALESNKSMLCCLFIVSF